MQAPLGHWREFSSTSDSDGGETQSWWFGAVAGASAGALTATLIASGIKASEVVAKTTEGLHSIGNPALLNWIPIRKLRQVLYALWCALMVILGFRSSFLTNSGLRNWLDKTLREQVAVAPDAPVTFLDLWATTNIDLFVLTMNLATKEPVVFNYRLTPNASVVEAVLASCANPGRSAARASGRHRR